MASYKAKTTENKCPFCEIGAGRLQTATFWEDSEFMAFLSIDPNTDGFSCVIPKKHFENKLYGARIIYELSELPTKNSS